jgi:hypothetical protein
MDGGHVCNLPPVAARQSGSTESGEMMLAAGPPIYSAHVLARRRRHAGHILRRVRDGRLDALAACGDPDRTGPHGGGQRMAYTCPLDARRPGCPGRSTDTVPDEMSVDLRA